MQHLQRQQPQLSWLVISGEAEEDHFPEIEATLNHSGLPWRSARTMDLTALTNLLRDCCGLLGHDSGISHLAAACGVPCRLLFGPTQSAVWAPAGSFVKVLQAPEGSLPDLAAPEVIAWLDREPLAY